MRVITPSIHKVSHEKALAFQKVNDARNLPGSVFQDREKSLTGHVGTNNIHSYGYLSFNTGCFRRRGLKLISICWQLGNKKTCYGQHVIIYHHNNGEGMVSMCQSKEFGQSYQ